MILWSWKIYKSNFTLKQVWRWPEECTDDNIDKENVWTLRSHWTYPSSKSTCHIAMCGGDLVVVMATVLTVMYTDRFV